MSSNLHRWRGITSIRYYHPSAIDLRSSHLSGTKKTVEFDVPDLEELFYDLEWRLTSKTAINHFYTTCGLDTPYSELHDECKKTFRHLDNEWRRRVAQHGVWPTLKFMHRCDSTSALYLLLAHNNLYYQITDWAQIRPGPVPNPHDNMWSDYLDGQAHLIADLQFIFGRSETENASEAKNRY